MFYCHKHNLKFKDKSILTLILAHINSTGTFIIVIFYFLSQHRIQKIQKVINQFRKDVFFIQLLIQLQKFKNQRPQ